VAHRATQSALFVCCWPRHAFAPGASRTRRLSGCSELSSNRPRRPRGAPMRVAPLAHRHLPLPISPVPCPAAASGSLRPFRFRALGPFSASGSPAAAAGCPRLAPRARAGPVAARAAGHEGLPRTRSGLAARRRSTAARLLPEEGSLRCGWPSSLILLPFHRAFPRRFLPPLFRSCACWRQKSRSAADCSWTSEFCSQKPPPPSGFGSYWLCCAGEG